MKTGFVNIVEQSPGSLFEGRNFKLLALEDDVYLIMAHGSRLTVFTLFPEMARVLPNSEFGLSPWGYLCQRQIPKEGLKELRFSFDLTKRLPQGAKNFAARVSTKFDFQCAQRVFQQLGGAR